MVLSGRHSRPCRATAGLLMGDHVHVDLARVLHDRGTDALVEDAGPPGPSRRADHQLGGVLVAGEIQQGAWYVVADHRVQRGAEAQGEFPNLAHLRCGDARKSIPAHDVHDHQFRTRLRRNAGCPAHQGL